MYVSVSALLCYRWGDRMFDWANRATDQARCIGALLCMHACLCICVRMYTRACVHVCGRLRVWCVCVCACDREKECVYVCVCFVNVHACASDRVSVSMGLCLQMRVCAFVLVLARSC